MRAPLDTAERQLRSILSEEYVDFGKQPPAMNLLQAIGDYTSPPFALCCEADILYVMHSYHEEAPKPAWVVHMYGLPPDPDGIDHMRNVIDAASGVRIVTVNLPMPTVSDLEKMREE